MQPLVAPVTHWSLDLHQNTGAPQGENSSYVKLMGISAGHCGICEPVSLDLRSAPLCSTLPTSEGQGEPY